MISQIGRSIEGQQVSASWVKPGQRPETVVIRGKFEPKSMFIILIWTTGVIHFDCANNGKTNDNQNYIENSLKPVVKTL